jgi:hypothetical protein
MLSQFHLVVFDQACADELMFCVPDKWPFGVDCAPDVTKGVITREVA